MKKTKILTVLGVLLAMGITACNGGGESSDVQSQDTPATSQQGGGDQSEHKHEYGDWTQTKAPTCTEKGTEERVCSCGDKQTRDVKALGHDWNEWDVKAEATCAAPGSRERTCKVCGEKETEVLPQLAHDFGDDAEKVDVLEEEGSVKEEMYKCKNCTTTSVRWSALEYDKTKTAERSTKSPESRGSGKAIRFDSTANFQDQDTTKKGCHIVYNVYIPEAIEKASIYMKTSKRTDNTLPPVVNKMEDDNAKGYEYVDGELVRPATRYGLKIDGQVIIIPEDTSGQEWKDGINWYSLPGEYKFETAGIHEIEFYNLGGYRADFYEFALVGFGPHEHVAKYEAIDSRLNSDDKVVLLSQDKFNNEKAIEIAFKDFSDAPANPSGTNPWYMAKGSFATWKINVDKAIEGAKLFFSLECSSDTHLERHLFNEAKWNAEHPDEQVKLPGQSPDTVDEAEWRYSIAVGDTEFPILNNKTMGESGVKAKNEQTYVYFGNINLAAGENVIKLTQNNIGYRMKFNQNVRIVYSSDAVIAGDHAHLFTELVSETPATCEAEGSKVMKCVCGEQETVKTPALGHDFQVGEADANGVSALTCKREGCTAAGMQFNGFADNALGNNAAANDNGKLNKNATVTWTVTMPKAATAKVFINAAYSSGNGNKAFASGWAIKGGASADALEDGTLTLDTTARADSVLQQVSNYSFLEIGTVAATEGTYVISVTTYGSSAQARLMIDGLVRIVF